MSKLFLDRSSINIRSPGQAPRWPFHINRKSPQAAGLSYWWPIVGPSGGRTIRELVRGSDATFDSSMDTDSWGLRPEGHYTVSFDGTPGDLTRVPDEDGFSLPAGPCSVVFRYSAPAWGSNKGFTGKWVDASREWVIWTTTTNNQLEFLRRAGTSNAQTTLTNSAFYDGTPTFVCARTYANSDIDIVAWNSTLGLVASTPTTPTQALNTTGDAPLVFGSYDANQAVELACDMWDVRIYNRFLSNEEILHMALPETRWDLFREVQQRRFFIVAASGATSGTGSASGAATVTARPRFFMASAGVADAQAVGKSTNVGVFGSVGIATVSGIGSSGTTGDGLSQGVATVSGVGVTLRIADFSGAGIANVSAVGKSNNSAVAVSDGAGAASGTGKSTNVAAMTSVGRATVIGVGLDSGAAPTGSRIERRRRRN